MKTLYHAANAIEAQLLMGLLEQDGFRPVLLGAHLQGAVGEVPASGLVRLEIQEKEYAAARGLVERWQAGEFRIQDGAFAQD